MDLHNAVRAGVEGLLSHLEMISKDDRLARAHARYVRRLFDELVREGFTEEQALRIVTGAPLPGTR